MNNNSGFQKDHKFLEFQSNGQISKDTALLCGFSNVAIWHNLGYICILLSVTSSVFQVTYLVATDV